MKMVWIARITVPQILIDEIGATKMSREFLTTVIQPHVDEIVSAGINRRRPNVPASWLVLHGLINTYEFQNIDEVELVAE